MIPMGAPEQDLDRLFGADAGVLVVDMAAFTARAHEQGIGEALSAIHRMRVEAEPFIDAFDGWLVKYDADNIFALFPDAERAVSAALAITADRGSSAGVGFGRVLDFGDDLFGDEVNQASRLGEDIARHGQVLLTDAAAIGLREGSSSPQARPLRHGVPGADRYRPANHWPSLAATQTESAKGVGASQHDDG